MNRMLLRNQVTSLILYEEIKTTEAKAKKVKPLFEHLMTMAKKNDLKSRRRILGYLLDKKAAKKVFEVLVPRYQKYSSGLVTSYKIAPRLGDGAPMAIVRIREGEIPKKETEKEESEPKKRKTTKKSV